MLSGFEQKSHGEEDDAGNLGGSGDGGGFDGNDGDLSSPFTQDAPAGSPMRGREASGTAAPALGTR